MQEGGVALIYTYSWIYLVRFCVRGVIGACRYVSFPCVFLTVVWSVCSSKLDRHSNDIAMCIVAKAAASRYVEKKREKQKPKKTDPRVSHVWNWFFFPFFLFSPSISLPTHICLLLCVCMREWMIFSFFYVCMCSCPLRINSPLHHHISSFNQKMYSSLLLHPQLYHKEIAKSKGCWNKEGFDPSSHARALFIWVRLSFASAFLPSLAFSLNPLHKFSCCRQPLAPPLSMSEPIIRKFRHYTQIHL